MKIKIVALVSALVVVAIAPITAKAEGSEKIIRVDVTSMAPDVVVNDGGTITGFDIELLNATVSELGLKPVYRIIPDFVHIWDGLRDGTADVAASGITITEAREVEFDFTHQYLDAGLAIIAPVEHRMSWLETARGIVTSKTLIYFIVFLLLMAHVAWWVDLGDGAIKDQYRSGIFEAFYWCVVTASTVGYGDISPKKTSSRVVAIILIFSGVLFFGMVVGEFSAKVAVAQVQATINGPNDLRGKDVATIAGSTSIAAITKIGGRVHAVPTMDAARELLDDGDVAAIVYDAPVLKYELQQRPSEKVAIVGAVFDPQAYGFVLPDKSPLREPLNRAFITVRENGTYDGLYRKWFGE